MILVGPTEELAAQTSLTPGDTSLCVTFVSAAVGTKPCAFGRQDLVNLGTSKILVDQGAGGPGGPAARSCPVHRRSLRRCSWGKAASHPDEPKSGPGRVT